MIKFEEFGKEVHAICCAFDGAERVGIAAIEALSDFARRENDAELNRPSVVSIASILPPQFMDRLKRHVASVSDAQAEAADNSGKTKTEDGALSIQAGSSYEDGHGDRIHIESHQLSPSLICPFGGNNGRHYAKNGRCNGSDRSLDLVREVESTEPIAATEDDPYAPPEKLETAPDARTLTKSEAAALKAAGAAAGSDYRFVKMVDVKVGETYLRRDGTTTQILYEDENVDYPSFTFRSAHGVSYNASGGWHPSGIKHELDLVSHVPKATAEPTPTATTQDAGAVTFHEPEGVEPFDQVGGAVDFDFPGDDRPQHAVLTEPLEVGKLYLRRDGGTEAITSRDDDGTFPFTGDSFNSYTKFGTVFTSASMENDADLVALID